MTDEQKLAERYVNGIPIFADEGEGFSRTQMQQAFLAGLKVERIEELEKPYDYRSVVYVIEHILLGYKNDISPNLRAKLNHWKNNIQEELDKG